MRNRSRWRFIIACVLLLAVACSDDIGDGAGPTTTSAVAEPFSDPATSDSIARPDSAASDEVELRLGTEPVPDQTPLEIGDHIRTGVLDNGLTYYVQSNDSPGSKVSMRLVVGAGGVHEDPIGTGVAHFLEHMMFNGTERFPANELDSFLRSIGAEIGADFNAYTSSTETVYLIDVEDAGDNVDTGFDVLVQWASAATIDPAEVAAEAPIVREEIRVRDESGDGLIGVAFEEAYNLGTPFEGVNVGGTAEHIDATTAADLRAYYDTWYRPDNMAVVAVGDRSLDDLEDAIIDRFSGLEARGPFNPFEVPDFDLRTDPYVDVIVEPSFGDSFVSVDIPLRSWDQNTVGGQRLLTTEILLGLMIHTRLTEAVAGGRLDLRRARGGYFVQGRGLQYMGFNLDADDLEAGTEAFMSELRGSIINGFTQRELDRQLDAFRAFQEQRLQQAATTQDPTFAAALVEHFLGGGDLQSIADSVSMSLGILDDLTLDEVNNHWRWSMTNAAPIVLVVGPDDERVGDPANHLAALERAALADVGTVDDDVVEIVQLMERPDPVNEVESSELARNDGFELLFENGMRLLFSPSTISENQVALSSESPGGTFVLDPADAAVAAAAVAAVENSGVGPYDNVQVRRYLSDLNVGLGAVLSETFEGFGGGASTEDIEVLFQLLHLMATSPRVDDVPFRQQVEFARDQTIKGTLDSSVAADLATFEARFESISASLVPTLDQLDGLTPEEALEIYTDRFASLDDHVVVVVGDVDEDVVVDLARRYIGTLPPADRVDSPPDPPPPGEVSRRLSVGSGTASGAYRLLTEGTADETVENRVLAELSESLLNDRLFSVVREQLGATYGGSAAVLFREPGDRAGLLVAIDGDPARIDEIADAVEAELDLVAAGDISDADFAEARAVLASRYNFIDNGFIIESLFDEADQSDERVIERGAQIDALSRTTKSAVADFVSAIVSDINRIDIRNIPAG